MRAAVLGSPIGHSLSPLLHRSAYAALGLDWTYDAVEVAPDDLPAFLDGLDADWAGLSLTMPLKAAVLPLLDEVSPLARDVAAANTVLLRDGRRIGHNTDVDGLLAALAEAGITSVSRGAVLGGGATARSALAALARLGDRRPLLLARSEPTETLAAAARLGVEPEVRRYAPGALRDRDLVVSTLPPGAGDRLADEVACVPALLDVVYDPWPTAMAATCTGIVVAGDRMLLHQAARQVELMTGRPAPLAAMDAALRGRARAATSP
jgi:shikimate dehydrogenase